MNKIHNRFTHFHGIRLFLSLKPSTNSSSTIFFDPHPWLPTNYTLPSLLAISRTSSPSLLNSLPVNTLHGLSFFKIHCRAFDVLDHIIPDSSSQSSQTSQTTSQTPPKNWAKLDAIVLQWIYGTITNELLLNILSPYSTAQQAWDRLKGIFYDNQNSLAVHLTNQFANTKLEAFSSMSAYCQEMKHIADQLGNIGPKVKEDCLVLQLITGLSDSYDIVASLISHAKKLPTFYEARSMLILEETRTAKQSPVPNHAVLVTTASSPLPRVAAPNHFFNQNNSNRGCTNYRCNGRGHGFANSGRGRMSY
ncbi:uncharacterized protein [Rutidosis leptorrhynchoides]|uniref:uncharacterized protein n=1 Tax=Rutidosis leptorrhynchoides TaxID=125765 RepID=UPI003A990F23